MSDSTFNPNIHPRNPAGAKLLRKVFKAKTGRRGPFHEAWAVYAQLKDGPDRHGPRHTWPKEVRET